MTAKRIDIQVLRALAVLMVIFFHLEILPTSGYLGVDIFFVVSGFVITNSLLRHVSDKSGVTYAFSFLRRRAQRLLPALFWMLVTCMTFSAVFLSPFDFLPTASSTAVAALFGLGNVVIALQSGDYFALAAERNPFLHTWSLGVEEQFYALVATLLLIGGGARFLRGRLAVLIFATLFSGSLFVFILGTSGFAFEGLATVLGFYSPLSRAWEMAIGVLLAIALSKRKYSSKKVNVRIRYVVAATALFSLILISCFPDSDGQSRGPLTVCAVLLTMLILWGNVENDWLKSQILRPIIKLGDYSYSAYLWHWPLTVFSRELVLDKGSSVVLTLIFTIVATICSGRWLEFPVSRDDAMSQPGKQLPLITAASLSFVLAVGFTVTAFNVKHPPSFFTQEGGLKDGIPCPSTKDLSFSCTTVNGDNGKLLVAGDSTALPFFQGAEQYAGENNYSLIFTSMGGCPAIRPGTRYPRVSSCVDWQEALVAYISAEQLTEIWLLNRSGAYTNPELGFYGVVSDDGRLLKTNEDIAREWFSALEFMVETAPKTKFVIFQSHPEPPNQRDPRTLLNSFIGYPNPPDRFSRLNSHVNRLNGYDAQNMLQSQQVQVVDPYEALCSVNDCDYYSEDGQAFYWDNSHLTSVGAAQVLRHNGFLSDQFGH